MNFLIIGLGSMGKRRIRCLKKLGISERNIWGYDVRNDRKLEAKNQYNINTLDRLDENIFNDIDAVIISTPPDKHNEYLRLAIDFNKPAFVEASIILSGLEEINNLAKEKNCLIAPSCTLLFHPIIKDIKKIVDGNQFGKVTNFSYHTGQYLPDWHPWESIKDFYVSKRATGGAREMVAFELTWIIKVFNQYPIDINGFFGKTINLECDIDDTYVIAMNFGDFLGTIVVDVVSRIATRRLTLNLEYAQIYWDWNSRKLEIYDALSNRKILYEQPEGTSYEGYNKNIIEEMYIEEIQTFIDAIKNVKKFPNSLDEDIKVLKLLQKIEGNILP